MKYGLVGFGTIARVHVRAITEILKSEIVAICDPDIHNKKEMTAGLSARLYTDYRDMLAREAMDVVVILTPHYSHPEISTVALQAGCHVFCEKPVAVHKNHAAPLQQALLKTNRMFGVNYMNRFRPDVQALKAVLDNGALGKIQTVHFVNNNWLRSRAYYSSGNWRGTWSREGGGVLTNQSPHDLDRIIYLFGLPAEVQAMAGTSSFHRELFVEDHVDALLGYENGMVLYFSTATHLHPGVDRMEIWGDRGYFKMENNVITTAQLAEPLESWNEKNREMFGAPQPEWKEHKITPRTFDDLHAAGHVNFANAVAGKEPIMTDFQQALQSVEMANAMVLAGFSRERVTLPLDGERYEGFLKTMIAKEDGK